MGTATRLVDFSTALGLGINWRLTVEQETFNRDLLIPRVTANVCTKIVHLWTEGI